jgi:hypothetical protein
VEKKRQVHVHCRYEILSFFKKRKYYGFKLRRSIWTRTRPSKSTTQWVAFGATAPFNQPLGDK